jgi:D-alanyl-D-alanine carboxypeptidase/D-alanyl-D-alanine-endopeptidase (penicillin-binding protein 4)
MRVSTLPIFALLVAGCATAPSPLGEVGRILAAHDDHPVQVCALVVDLDTGETVLSREAQRLCRPASTMKLLTTSSICRRDVERPFVTQAICDGTPAGELVLIGDGDPFLSTANLRWMADNLAAQGVEKIDGWVRVMDPLSGAPRWGEGWMWDDEPSTFQPLFSGIPVDRGCVTVALSGEADSFAAELLPVAGDLRTEVASFGGGLRVSRGRYREPDVVRVTGGLPDGEPTTRRISVPDPARFTGKVFADALRRAGIDCQDGVEVEARREVAAGITTQFERSLADVVVETNKVSDNLGAELLLRRLASMSELHAVDLGPESETIGCMTVAADLEDLGVAADGFRIADGSGVSHYNLVSADLLVRILVDMDRRDDAGGRLFRRSLPVAGVDGTLKNRMKGTAAERRVSAKTGTISAVSNLAGYVETRSGRRLAFAILCQNFVGPARPWRQLQDRICAELAEL